MGAAMSEQQSAETTETAVEVTTEAPVILPDDHPLVRTLAAQKEALKEFKAKAARLDDIEEAQKSEIEKAEERARRAEEALAAQAIEAAKFKVAAEKNVPPELLNGSTEAEMAAAADRLIAFRGEQPVTPGARVPGEGRAPATALNSDGLEQALKDKLGI